MLITSQNHSPIPPVDKTSKTTKTPLSFPRSFLPARGCEFVITDGFHSQIDPIPFTIPIVSSKISVWTTSVLFF